MLAALGGPSLAPPRDEKRENMGRGDNRRTMKMRRRKAQSKIKLRIRKRREQAKS